MAGKSKEVANQPARYFPQRDPQSNQRKKRIVKTKKKESQDQETIRPKI